MPDFLQGSVRQYLDQLASGEPTPGGGSAAALSGALGAALLCMSARFTVGREKYAAFQAQADMVLQAAEDERATLQQLMEEDSVAFAGYSAAIALPKGTDEEKVARKRALQEATKASAQVPMSIARRCYRLLELAGVLAANCNPYLVSDVVVASHMALAGFNSAVVNVRLNLASLEDMEFVSRMSHELSAMTAKAGQLARTATEIGYRVMHLPLEGDFPA